MSGVLTIPVKGIYFDQIASGEKREEYRVVTRYWSRRIRGRSYDAVVLTRGYPKGGGVEGVTRLTRQWRGAMLRTITHPHFGNEPELVFAIDVSVPAQVGTRRMAETGTGSGRSPSDAVGPEGADAPNPLPGGNS